jgi:hypothetical protein
VEGAVKIEQRQIEIRSSENMLGIKLKEFLE